MSIARKDDGTLLIEDAKIIWPNFSGKPTKFNPAGGKRDFNVIIDDPDVAQQMRDEGWNVKIKPPREEGDGVFCYMQVAVEYPTPEKNFPMRIVQFADKRAVDILEDAVSNLDYARIKTTKMAIRPYHWQTATGSGIKAYLKTLHIVLEEEDFAEDYEAYTNIAVDEDSPF